VDICIEKKQKEKKQTKPKFLITFSKIPEGSFSLVNGLVGGHVRGWWIWQYCWTFASVLALTMIALVTLRKHVFQKQSNT
jgi:hypothetical protein